MEDQGERAVPRQQMQVDGLSTAHRGGYADDSKDGRYAGEESENAFCPGGAESANENLQRGAQKKYAWSHQDEGRDLGRGIHAFMLKGRALGGM